MRTIALFFLLALFLPGLAQEKNSFSVNGTVGIFQDWYSLQSSPKDSVLPRRPSSLTRIQFAPAFNIGPFSLPFNINITAKQTNVVTPQIPNQNINQFLQNPLNNISFNPSYKWAQLLLGTQLPRFSELTAGDLTAFGAGFKLTPGKYRITFFHGVSQRAIEPDTANFITGIYKQKLTAFQLGYGKEEETYINFNIVSAKDVTNSVSQRPAGINPKEGITTSFDGQKKFKEGWFIKGEAAGSVFNRNLLSVLPDSSSRKFLLFSTRDNFHPGYAGSFAVGKQTDKYNINVKAKYLDENFIPAAYPFALTDIFDYTLNTSFKAWKQKINFTGSIGQRFNNVSGNASSTSKQIIGNGNLNVQFNDNWSLNTSFSNYGFRNVTTNTQQKIDNISNDFSLSPTYTKQTEKIYHLVTATYNRSHFKDYDFITSISSTNNSTLVLFLYSQTYLLIPLNAAGSISYFKNNSSFGDYTLGNISFEAGYRFAKNKLSSNIRFDYNSIQFTGYTSNTNLLTTLSLKYKVRKDLLWTIQGMINLFNYGTERPGVSYTEDILRTSLVYNFDSHNWKKKKNASQ
ncbi:MAG: hypothetical protein ACHQEB_04300 [Chitinophagales bacterium]